MMPKGFWFDAEGIDKVVAVLRLQASAEGFEAKAQGSMRLTFRTMLYVFLVAALPRGGYHAAKA